MESTNGTPSGRNSKGQFAPGSSHARGRTNGELRRSLARELFEVVTPEGLAQALRNLLAFASDPRKPTVAIRAADLLTKLAGLQVTSLEFLQDESPSPAAKAEEIRSRLAEILADRRAPDAIASSIGAGSEGV
jgi:hypothetical protein